MLSRDMVLLLASVFFLFGSATLTAAVVPVVVNRVGDSSLAGLVVGVYSLCAILLQLQMPRILGRYQPSRVIAVALLLVGGPSLVYIFLSHSVPAMLLAAALRGAGFGMGTVGCTALAVDLAPAERRGEAVGYYGLALAPPSIVAAPASPARAERSQVVRRACGGR